LAALDAYHVGRYHLANGDRDKALEAFDDAVRMNPQFVQAYIARGKLYAEAGKFESALADLNFAIRIQPTHPEAFAYRGYALLSLGRPQESIPEFDMALRLDQSYARVYFLRGQALRMLGDDNGAASSIALARRLDPTIEVTKVVTAAADGSLKEEIGLVSGDRSIERTPGAGLPGMLGEQEAATPATLDPGRVIHFEDHPLLGDLKAPRNARPLHRPAPTNHAHHRGTAGGRSNGYPQFGANPSLAGRGVSPAIPDITAVPETPLPSAPMLGGSEPTTIPADVASGEPTEATTAEAAGSEPIVTEAPPAIEQTAEAQAAHGTAGVNVPAKITLSPHTVVQVPTGAEGGELPKIVVIPPPTTIGADGSLPVVVEQPQPAAAPQSVAVPHTGSVPQAEILPPAVPRVEVPHVVTIAPGAMPPGAADMFKVDPAMPAVSNSADASNISPGGAMPSAPEVVVADDAAPEDSVPTASEILQQHVGALPTAPVGQDEQALASAVISARSLLPGDAPSLAHVSDDGSTSPTRLAPANSTVAGDVSAAAAAYSQGIAFEEAGDFKNALVAYAEASRLNPADPLPTCRRGHILCELQRTAEALAEFEAAVHAAPGFSSAYFGRAHVQYLTDQLEDAVDNYTIALRLDDRHAQALLERGHCYARMGKAAEAAADRAAALALDPVLVENGPRYATDIQARKPLPAGSVIVSDESASDQSETTAPQAIAVSPSAPPAAAQSAFQNLFEGARPIDGATLQAAAAPQTTPPASRPTSPRIVVGDGDPASAGRAPAAAVVQVSDDAGEVGSVVSSAGGPATGPTTVELQADPALAALNRSPASAEGVVALDADVVEGRAAKTGQAKASAEERARLTEQISSRPGDASLYLARARECLGLGDAAAALDDVTTALRLVPTDRAALALRAEALAAVNKFPAAHADYVQLLADNPNDSKLYSGRGYVRLAMGQTAEAIDDFNMALKLDPKTGQVYCQRALAYALAGDQAAAMSDFDAAIAATPDDAEVFLCRAKALAEFGDKRRALADLNQAIKLDPTKAEAYFERSRLYAEKGAYENAQADRRRALTLDPSLR
jgi:tetratricopeptide (TPR) repeat protein